MEHQEDIGKYKGDETEKYVQITNQINLMVARLKSNLSHNSLSKLTKVVDLFTQQISAERGRYKNKHRKRRALVVVPFHHCLHHPLLQIEPTSKDQNQNKLKNIIRNLTQHGLSTLTNQLY